jgi:hypothetical protein
MKHRDIEHFPERNIQKHTTAGAETFTPDLNLANVFRVDGSAGALAVANPTNGRDGQYIRIEIVSAAATVANFGTGYHVDGAVIADGTHTANDLVIYEGYYNEDTDKWNLVELASKAA